ncbi:MAG TPA: hypothetical protein VGB59_03355 [Allosphingosinicella sp.]|jgi:hypothetical protein
MGAKRKAARRERAAVDWAAFADDVAERMRGLGMPEAEARAEGVKQAERTKLRLEWMRERFDAFLAMQDKAGDAYLRQMDEHPEVDWEGPDAPELPEPPEEAIAQAIYAEVMAAVHDDQWPRHLHFHEV